MLYFALDHLVHVTILIILALSLNLINGFTGMFSLGHHGFFAAGAYAAGAFILFTMPTDPGLAVTVAWFVMSLGAGIAAAALFGLIVGVPCLRLKGDYLAIATLGFGEIVRIIAQNTESVGGARGLEVPYLLIPRSRDTEIAYVGLYLTILVVMAVITYVVIRNILRSTHGRALIAIREDETAAELLGVNLTRYKVAAFVIGAGFAGLAGALYTNYMTQIEPKEFNLIKGIYILLYVVLGGMGSMSGTVLATILLYALDKVILNLMPPEIQAWREVFFALLLVVVMVSRPQGLLGHKEIYQTALWKRIFGKRGDTQTPAAP
ncbi:MAG: branched-chain amino acid ABC transporter permease [Myxococcales bacterium]|nr:branched-chain amino acid ABC transporter permease [Myxococcales bacterium]